MIVCHVCGTENPDGSKFCEGCGVELSAPVSLNVGAIATPEVAAFVPPTIENTELFAASEPVAELAALPEITPPPLPDLTSDESALDLETEAVALPEVVMPAIPEVVMPAVPEVVVPAVPEVVVPAIAPVVAVLGSTLDGTVNPKATMETPIRMARLIPRNLGANSNEGYTMHSERMVVGRFDPSAGPVDIDLSGGQGENYISRRHAEVYLEQGAWLVRDLGSTNGVYVKRAGQAQYSPRIIEPQILADGDEVAFGNMKFLFVYSSDGA